MRVVLVIGLALALFVPASSTALASQAESSCEHARNTLVVLQTRLNTAMDAVSALALRAQVRLATERRNLACQSINKRN
jgi:hypothetical protein